MSLHGRFFGDCNEFQPEFATGTVLNLTPSGESVHSVELLSPWIFSPLVNRIGVSVPALLV